MQKPVQAIGFLASLAWIVSACAPPPPPAPATTGTGGAISVAVNPVGPPSWGYAVTSTGAKITSIELVSAINPADCNVTPPANPAAWVVNGLKVSDSAGALSATVSYECDKINGPAYLIVKDFSGSSVTIGPISGPT